MSVNLFLRPNVDVDMPQDNFILCLQVSVMQQELTALQPELIQTSAETDKMMVKIEGETVEVDAKKELVSADEKVANEAAAAAQAIKVCVYFRSNATFCKSGILVCSHLPI